MDVSGTRAERRPAATAPTAPGTGTRPEAGSGRGLLATALADDRGVPGRDPASPPAPGGT
ncbi:hypothetical protein ACFFUA_17435 [Streptomyces heliomycini]|uniref:Uncharacterized protein n=1 Tax=Streptomyces heliomycini TaxID=284032 RepID=A0ABV5LAN8_9ACTN